MSPRVIPIDGRVERITSENFQLVLNFGWNLQNLASFVRREPFMAVIQNEMAVAVCFCSRLTPHAAKSGLETLEGYRGQRYGSAAVVAWASAVKSSGRLPLYSTHWTNEESLGVARKLELVTYGSDLSIR